MINLSFGRYGVEHPGSVHVLTCDTASEATHLAATIAGAVAVCRDARTGTWQPLR